NPVCTRYIPMEGWCYGTENTILVNPASGSTVDFDIRANGDFFNVMRHAKKPAKLKCQMADVVNTGTWNTWSIDGTTSSNGGVVALASMTPSIGRSSNAIASSKTSVAGFFNLLDADDNVIWRFTFWASEPAAITLTNGDVMDRNLGGYDPATGTNAQQQGVWCQWGRPFGFGWAAACQDAAYSTAVTDLAGSAAHANAILITTASSPADYHWLQTAEQHVDLWGCTETVSSSKGGVKSIFDPCPKGWKVASPALFAEIVAGTQTYTTSPTNGFSVSVAGKTVFLPGTAQRDGSNGNVGGSSGSTRKRLAYWSDTANKRRGFWLYCADATAASAAITMNSNRSSHGAGIRCMKDTANR
ncbi:MAG: hypothetical protein IJ799_00960, partial [Bacteroidales bacterium]|nr:hypothetical protein [Bacteroidales bacterium]